MLAPISGAISYSQNDDNRPLPVISQNFARLTSENGHESTLKP